jgi:uncharacterized membrane protein YjjP (DUF1212 family)
VSGPSEPAAEPARALRVILRIAVGLLGSGAPTDDVEADMSALAGAFGVAPVQAAVTFSTVTVSMDRGDRAPITAFHFVRDRTVDFSRLAALSEVVGKARAGVVGLDEVEAELAEVERGRPAYHAVTRFVAPAVSALGSTIIFGGNGYDGLATLGVALAIQPALTALDRTTLPPFFRVAFGAVASATLVALLVILGADIHSGLVLTGSLLRFLPGYALVSGFRDLVSQSIVSGTARLAEALVSAAAIAGGLAVAIRIAAFAHVQLGLQVEGSTTWMPWVLVVAALLAVGGFAIQLGVPRREVAFAAALGAVAWSLRDLTVTAANGDAALATIVAATFIGAVGRVLATQRHSLPVVFVVPAILPLLPGLLLVQAMLATNDLARLGGLIDAAATALFIGVGVATGDIIVATVARFRARVLAPAVNAVAGGVDVLLVGPVARVLGGSGHPDADDDDEVVVEGDVPRTR